MVDVLLHLQKVLVPRDLLQQLARVRSVELDAEVERESLHAFYLSVNFLVWVEPVRLREVVNEAQPEVGRLQQVEVLVDHVQKVLTTGGVLDLLDELGFVQEDHLTVEGLGLFAEAAPHGETRTPSSRRAGHSPAPAKNRILARRRSRWHRKADSPGQNPGKNATTPPPKGRSPCTGRAAKSRLKAAAAAKAAEPSTLLLA